MNQKTKQKTKLTSLLLVLCMVIGMLPAFTIDLTAFATETASTDSSEDWEYVLTSDGTATLTKFTGTATDVYIPSTVTDKNDEPVNVTALGEGVFKNNTAINSATFGEGITTIGASAFEGATNLVCIVSPETLTTIGDRAFYGCDVFNSVILYDAVTTIGTDVFAECPSVTVWVNEGSAAYAHVVENSIPYEIINPDATPETYVQDGVTYYIMNGEAYATAFDGSVTELVIPSMIEGYPVVDIRTAFEGSNIVNIILPNGIKSIKKSAFSDCEELSSITLPDSVTQIGPQAFNSCVNLRDITIPPSVNELGLSSFEKCESLETINIPDGITIIPHTAFKDCKNLVNVILPQSVKTIDPFAFIRCESLTHIKLPNGLTRIDSGAFQGCIKLKGLEIPNTVTVLSNNAFWECSNLIQLLIPSSVSSIGSNCFSMGTVLIVYENSTALTYAKTNSLNYIIYKEGELPQIDTYTIDGVTYSLLNGEATALNYDGVSKKLTIPESILGYRVTNIDEVFEGSELEYISLPGTISFSDNAFKGCENLTEVKLAYGIKRIGSGAFSGCVRLSEINIPDSVSYIGEAAFANCELLENIVIPNSVRTIDFKAFYGCEQLQNVTIEEGTTKIGSDAFFNCKNIKTITLPKSLTFIGLGAFDGCTKLRKVVIPSAVNTIRSGNFEKSTIWIVYPNSYAYNVAIENDVLHIVCDENGLPQVDEYILNDVTYWIINGEAYAIDYVGFNSTISIPEEVAGYPVADIGSVFNDSSVEKVIIPNSIDNIAFAFSNCKNLKSVTLPENIQTIGDSAFGDCENLKEITIPSSVKTIDSYAFKKCSSLEKIIIPKDVTAINAGAFSGCSQLTEIVLPNGLTTIGSSAFSSCKSLESIKIPAGITEIRSGTFSNNSNLKSISLPESIKIISDHAFHYCTGLKNIVLPNSVTTIGAFAFQSSGLTNITIPNSVTSIDRFAFRYCEALEEVELQNGLQDFYSTGGFSGCTKLKVVKIPDSIMNIGPGCFSECSSIKQVIIPKNVLFRKEAFPSTTIWLVDENSPAHIYAQENDVLYFVLRETSNPEISYGAGISGTVTLDGMPASGAEVSLLYDDGVVKETVTTDDTGAYSFTYAEVGAYTIRATAGNASGTEKVSVKRMNAFDVFLTGETDIVLKGAYTVSGTVSPATATVTLTDTDGNVIETQNITTGAYSFANVPNGSYIVKAETDNASAIKEVTVFNGDVTVEDLVIDESSSAIITGTVDICDREGGKHKKVWVNVTLYNEDGISVAQTKTKEDGTYEFENVPLGNYSLVAETEEMRPDKKHDFDRAHKLRGYAYVEIAEATTYTVDITGYEENDCTAEISGKATAQGEPQLCEVILSDVFRHEIAKCSTGNNGKYTFRNVADGLYFITAITKSNGMGFTVVVVRDGKVYGNPDIYVWKADKINNREKDFDEFIKGCPDKDSAKEHRSRIAEEKRWYDGLSEKEKKQCSREYIENLNKLCGWISECESTSNYDGATLTNGEQLLSGDELESEESFELVLNITESTETEMDSDGIKNKKQYEQKQTEDAAGKKNLVKYYDISLSKKDGAGNCHTITSIARDTDTTGKVRITMDIPEEHRGHKHYHFVHVHNGVATTLIDLDDDPDTITFEVDKFSTFALTYTDEVLSVDGELEEEEIIPTIFGERSGYIRNYSFVEDGKIKYQAVLFSGIDSINYREVGFEVTVNGETVKTGTKVVYTSLLVKNATGAEMTVIPSDFGKGVNYIYGYIHKFPESFKTSSLSFRPYAIDMNGDYIYGKTTTIDKIYNK